MTIPFKFILTFMMFFLLTANSPCAPNAAVKELLANPAITHVTSFSAEATPEMWRKMMDHLYLMGKIWEAYGFEPPYKVARIAGGVHVMDPNGIVGDVVVTEISGSKIVFYGRGKFDHWAVPSVFSANGVIIFRCQPAPKGLTGKLEFYIKGDNGLMDFFLRLVSDSMVSKIEQAFLRNMKNVDTIASDIMNRPETVRKRLAGPLLQDFDRVF